jgi:hypothetical protein
VGEDRWFTEEPTGEWTMVWPEGWVGDLAASLTAVVNRLRTPQPEVWIVDASGDRYDHAELAIVATDSTEAVMDGVRQPTLRGDELAVLGASAGNLSLIASAAVELDELASGPGDGQVGLVAARDFFDRMARRVFLALDGGVRQLPDGRFSLEWRSADRSMVAALASDFDELVQSDDPSITRLFPPAYGADDERSSGYAALTRDELVQRRRASATALLEALDAESIDADQLTVVMRAVNDLRLVVGTSLNVSEDDDRRVSATDPDATMWATYERLTAMLSHVIAALGMD